MTSPLYIWPPHPSSKMRIPPEELDRYERTGEYIAQPKYNGGRAVIIINNTHSDLPPLEIYSRHNEPFKNLKTTDSIRELFKTLDIKKYETVVLDGEFLGTKAVNKVSGKQAVEETLVLFDILFLNENLYQMKQMYRLALLNQICREPEVFEPKKRALQVATHNSASLWLAPVFYEDFNYHFYNFYDFDDAGNDLWPEIEGLVLRRKNGLLKLGDKHYDTNALLRCRKPSNRHGRF